MRIKWPAAIVLGLAGGLALAAAWLYPQLEVPAPTGAQAVGRTVLRWVDETRAEVMTADTSDRRAAPVVVWYPAAADTGEPAGYYPDLAAVADELAASGEVGAMEVWGLRYIRSEERREAAPAAGRFPVVLLSPGNGTNVEFYAGLAGELAS